MAAAAWPGPQRHSFTTADPVEAREVLDQAFGGRVRVNVTAASITGFALTLTDAGSFTVCDLMLPGDLGFGVTGQDTIRVATMLAGTEQADRANKVTDRYQPGDVWLSNWPQASYTSHTHHAHASGFTLPVSLFHAVADVEPTASSPPRFVSLHPVSAAARTRWLNASGYAASLLASPAASPLLIGSAARLLAATVLTAFPNVGCTGPAARDRTDASPATVRLATAFIEEHAARDTSIAEVAAAANVTIRAVQLAFRRHLDTTPLDYLQRVRLDRARAELLAADPARKSVAAVAHRWGFPSPERFAAAYRQAYGVHPDRTLGQDSPQAGDT
ncbi:MAG TPA: helix-turn-helix transcriptional regulator [Streptosporangiaceae bacterium]|nr:helix-turn-helix transcriptional regulator [Streptosporangiaceae bacterium]